MCVFLYLHKDHKLYGVEHEGFCTKILQNIHFKKRNVSVIHLVKTLSLHHWWENQGKTVQLLHTVYVSNCIMKVSESFLSLHCGYLILEQILQHACTESRILSIKCRFCSCLVSFCVSLAYVSRC